MSEMPEHSSSTHCLLSSALPKLCIKFQGKTSSCPNRLGSSGDSSSVFLCASFLGRIQRSKKHQALWCFFWHKGHFESISCVSRSEVAAPGSLQQGTAWGDAPVQSIQTPPALLWDTGREGEGEGCKEGNGKNGRKMGGAKGEEKGG